MVLDVNQVYGIEGAGVQEVADIESLENLIPKQEWLTAREVTTTSTPRLSDISVCLRSPVSSSGMTNASLPATAELIAEADVPVKVETECPSWVRDA